MAETVKLKSPLIVLLLSCFPWVPFWLFGFPVTVRLILFVPGNRSQPGAGFR